MEKKQLKVKNCPKNYTTSTLLNEGGIFHVNSIDNSGNMTATYEYIDDIHNSKNDAKKLYILFSCLPKHPRNENWVEYPWNDINFSKTYEKLDNNNPRNPKKYDEIVKGYRNKFYMPLKQLLGKGDNIKKITYHFTMDNGETIPCYNLSNLGDTHPTMLAHFYKGKPQSYRGHKINSVGTPKNMYKYIQNMVELIEDFPEIKTFNADYIIYPQSSSKFNDAIAKYLKKYVYTNARILPPQSLYKLSVWEINYDTLIMLTIQELNSPNNMFTRYMSLYNNNIELKNKLISNTIKERCCQTLSATICRSLKNILNSKKYVTQRNNSQKQIFLWNKMENLFKQEYKKIEAGLIKNNLPNIDYEKFLLSTFNRIFSSKDYGKYSKKFYKNREVLYSSYNTLKNAFCSEPPLLTLDVNKILSNEKNDTIKNYDNIQRYSISKQFDLNQDVEREIINKNSKFIIIDDNYATGASLRNASQLLLNKGFLSKNIITLTPGDMGSASTGGKRGAQIPFNNAESELAYDLKQNRLNLNNDLDINIKDRLNYVFDKTKDNELHKKRNKLSDMFYNAKQTQITDKDIENMVQECLYRIKNKTT